MVFQNNVLMGASGSGTTTHTIDQSIRFNNDDNAYMSRTQDTADSKRRLTFSWWMKRGSSLGTEMAVISAGASSRFMVRFNTSDKLTFRLTNGTTEKTMTTDMVFRDVSAWYHCVWIADCTASPDFSRLYVNGSLVTMTGTQPSADTDFAGYGDGSVMGISTLAHSLSSQEFDGYLAEMVLIDNDALLPTSFGEYNSSGIWIPKDVSGLTFGTNGFHIDGRDSADLGDDESGQGNDFSTNGLAAHDQVPDSPTNSFAVLNPLDERGSGTLSDGNLQMAFGATNDNVTATQGLNTGKWYWEVYIVDKDDPYVGVQDSGVASTGYTEDAVALWVDGGYIYEDGSDTGDRSTTYANGDIVGVAFDVDNKKIWWSKNGQWYSADDSSTATINISEVEAGNQAQVITRSPDFFMPFVGNYNTGTVIMNFGQEGTFAGNVTAGGNSDGNGVGNFKYSVPSGYLALCTKNLGS
jgi:hypothetical protein